MNEDALMKFWRWGDDYGGGLVVADSRKEAIEKLENAYVNSAVPRCFQVWPWVEDDFYRKDHMDVFDVYC